MPQDLVCSKVAEMVANVLTVNKPVRIQLRDRLEHALALAQPMRQRVVDPHLRQPARVAADGRGERGRVEGGQGRPGPHRP
jgi:hypothetical protein